MYDALFSPSIIDTLNEIKELFSDEFKLVKQDGSLFSQEDFVWINNLKARIDDFILTPFLIIQGPEVYFASDFPKESYDLAIDIEEMVVYDGETFDPDTILL